MVSSDFHRQIVQSARTYAYLCAGLGKGLGGICAQVKDDEIVASLDEIASHVGTHVAQPNEPNVLAARGSRSRVQAEPASNSVAQKDDTVHCSVRDKDLCDAAE